MPDTDALITKYRPGNWGEVIGQDAVCRSVAEIIERKSSQAFLLSGPSGVGKTTLGRLIAKYVGATAQDIIEVDAATYNGIDDMRALTEGLRYRPLGDAEVKVLIIDECHAISKAAWQSLLKSVEEPPEWVFWIFCTTDPVRVPETIKTRCAAYKLAPVTNNLLFDFLDDIASVEKLDVDGGVLDVCVKEASGSPRQALVNLALCSQCKDRGEAAALLRSAMTVSDAGKLAQALVSGKGWDVIQPILVGLEEVDPESIRMQVRGYVSKVIMGTPDGDRVARVFPILDAFSQPISRGDGLSGIVLACGRILFGAED